MDLWLRRSARVIGTILGAFAGLVALQLIRLRRTTFLSHGFVLDHIVGPDTVPGAPPTPLRMIVFGDSTTTGVGVERPDEALPVQLARELGRRRARRVHVTSYGWPGARVADLVREQVPRASQPWRTGEESPVLPTADIVVVVAGSNDATNRTPPRQYRTAVREALEMIREAAPHAEVVLAGIPIFRGALLHVEPLIWLTDQYARVLRPISRGEAARAGASFADLAGRLPGRHPPEAFASDRFHPSAAGYAAWAQVIADALDARPDLAPGPAASDLQVAGA